MSVALLALLALLSSAECGAAASIERKALVGLDGALGKAESGLGSLRRQLGRAQDDLGDVDQAVRPRPAGRTGDAALSGCALGLACGWIVVGDPKLLAVVGAASFAYVHRNPACSPRMAGFVESGAVLSRKMRHAFAYRVERLSDRLTAEG